MKRFFLFIVTITFIVSCTDTTDTIGMSLLENTNEDVEVLSKTCYVESQSVRAENVISRSETGYLGKVKDPETGTYITCNLMTQVSGNAVTQLPDTSLFTTHPVTTEAKADTCELVIYFDNEYGDSLAQMKVVAHELETPLEESVKYDTDIDSLIMNHHVRKDGGIHVQSSYTYANRMYSFTERANSAYPYIVIPLNDTYKDKDGKEYSNYGTYLLQKIYANKEKASNDWWFIHNICPGFYIETVGGVGNLASVAFTQLFVTFHTDPSLTKDYVASFAGTEEVLQKTAIKQSDEDLDLMTNRPNCTYLKTPAGIFTQLTLPVDSIMDGHENDTLNTTRIFIPRINNDSVNTYSLPIPETLLMVSNDDIASFFSNNKVADSKTSYLATYNSTYNGYTFGNISTLISSLYHVRESQINQYQKPIDDIIELLKDTAKVRKSGLNYIIEEYERTDTTKIHKQVLNQLMNIDYSDSFNKFFNNPSLSLEDFLNNICLEWKEVTRPICIEHYSFLYPNWNKVTLIPVETTSSTLSTGTSIITKVTYDMSLGCTMLKKGTDDNSSPIKASCIYSHFK